LDFVYEKYKENNNALRISIYDSKYQLLQVIRGIIEGEIFKEMFEYNRSWP